MNKNINEYRNMDSGKSQEEAKKAVNQLYIVLMAGIMCYYIMPFLCGLYLGGNKDIFNYIFLYINTVYSFVSCYIHSLKNGFKWYVPVAVGLFFVPSCMTFGYMGVSLLALVYLVLGLFGSFTGYLLYRKKYKKTDKRKAVKNNEKKNKKMGKVK